MDTAPTNVPATCTQERQSKGVRLPWYHPWTWAVGVAVGEVGEVWVVEVTAVEMVAGVMGAVVKEEEVTVVEATVVEAKVDRGREGC